MTVYVDDARVWGLGSVRTSHVAADDLAELHAFMGALQIGRFHRHREHPHYDVNESERKLAIAAGAVECRPRELLAIATCAKRNADNERNNPALSGPVVR